ncbi:MAG: hypothetical protein JO053_07040 [Acidobacteria bacterium]|nr:hypothetical protein [Acidobacteriota bacterium]
MDAIDQLKLMTAWDTEPALTLGELENVLSAASLDDSGGHAPADDDWEPTYDLDAAAAAAWLIKAARAAATVDEPTAGVVTSKIFDNCRKMAASYSNRRNTTVLVR